MTTQYHVFLPPPTLFSLPLPSPISDHSPLHFHDLPAPPRHQTFSQSSLPIQQAKIRPRLSEIGSEQPRALASDEKDSFEASTRMELKRGREEVDALAGGDGELGDQTRRRSRRIARTTASLLGTLPQLENTESFFSLNTTTSDPSQLPPTAAGNDSVSHLPCWSIPLSKLVTLHSLVQSRPRSRTRDKQVVSVMVCVMAVEQPVLRQRKEEKARGAAGTLWIGRWEVTAPPTGGEDAVKCDVKLWEGCARDWGDDKVRKGDVVLLENVEFKPASSRDPSQLILSPTPSHTPKPTILYRTLQRYISKQGDYAERPTHDHGGRGQARSMHADDRPFRPDLRLARSDAGIKRVVEYSRWFAGWIGGQGPP